MGHKSSLKKSGSSAPTELFWGPELFGLPGLDRRDRCPSQCPGDGMVDIRECVGNGFGKMSKKLGAKMMVETC